MFKKKKEYYTFSRNWKNTRSVELINWTEDEVMLPDLEIVPASLIFENRDEARQELKKWKENPTIPEFAVGDLVKVPWLLNREDPVVGLVVKIIDKITIQCLIDNRLYQWDIRYCLKVPSTPIE